MFYLLLSVSCLSLLLLYSGTPPMQKRDGNLSTGPVERHQVLDSLNLRSLRSTDSSCPPDVNAPTGDRPSWAQDERRLPKHGSGSDVGRVKQENGDATENVILLGQPEDAPYVVVIPGGEEALLDRVQAYYPRAFLTDSRLGRYVQAGAFSTYSEAVELNDQLRAVGFDARVVYLRVR